MRYIQKFEEEDDVDEVILKMRQRTEQEFMDDPIAHKLSEDIMTAKSKENEGIQIVKKIRAIKGTQAKERDTAQFFADENARKK